MKYQDTDYLHISTRSRVLESKLLGREALARLSEAAGPQEALRMLREYGFESGTSTSGDYEAILTEQQLECYSFLRAMLADSGLLRPFLLPYDYMNLKALMKAEILGISPDAMLFDTGTVGKTEIAKAFRERDTSVLGARMMEAVQTSLAAYAASSDPQEIDLITDRICYADILDCAETSGFDFLKDYFTGKIDLMNIQTFVRLKKIGKNYEFFEKTCLRGGIGPSFYEKLYPKPLAEFFAALRTTAYAPLSEFGDSGSTMTAFEQRIDELLGGMLQKLRRVAFGPQVPVAYLLSKEAEIKNVRIILSGKLAGLPGETIRERLRLGYV